MIDIARALKTATTTGEVRFGLAETKKSMKKGEAKLVVLASNCPEKDSLEGQVVLEGHRVRGHERRARGGLRETLPDIRAGHREPRGVEHTLGMSWS